MSQQVLAAIIAETPPPSLQVIQEMGDIEYLSKKEFDGKLRINDGELSTVGDIATLTANTGKDMYLGVATCTFLGINSAGAEATVVLKVNGVEVERVNFQSSGAGATQPNGMTSDSYEFKTVGTKVVATQIIKIELITEISATVSATLECFEEDTGADPTILASSITVEAEISGQTTDIAFVEAKVLAGDYFQVSGDIDTLASEIVFVVPNTKTAFLLEAKIVIPTHPGAFTSDRVTAELKLDGVVKDKTDVGVTAAFAIVDGPSDAGYAAGSGILGDGKFNVQGLSLVGDGVKEISIENSLDGGSAFATMSGYLIDT